MNCNSDKLVPLLLNSGLMKERYAALGGEMKLLVPPGRSFIYYVTFSPINRRV